MTSLRLRLLVRFVVGLRDENGDLEGSGVVDTQLRQAKKAMVTNPSLLSLTQYLLLKSRFAEIEDNPKPKTLAAKLKQDLAWCELETDGNQFTKDWIYVGATKESIVAALTFRGWEEIPYCPCGREHSIYMACSGSPAPTALRKNIFIRKAASTESVRFFYEKMPAGTPYLEMVEKTRGRDISVIYACLGSRYSDRIV